jgi:hypothetical protein
MNGLRVATIAVATACVLGFAGDAVARTIFDGSWSVTVTGRSGTCAGNSLSYGLQIRNGNIYYSGGEARVSGHVNPRGAVYVRVSSSQGSGVGSGRLSRSSGAGHFRGVTSNGPCAGTWTAQRVG